MPVTRHIGSDGAPELTEEYFQRADLYREDKLVKRAKSMMKSFEIEWEDLESGKHFVFKAKATNAVKNRLFEIIANSRSVMNVWCRELPNSRRSRTAASVAGVGASTIR
jgi:hypothetical protein